MTFFNCTHEGTTAGVCGICGATVHAHFPTTVRGWLETLPEPIRERALKQCNAPNSSCESLVSAIQQFADWSKETKEGHSFWLGVQHFLSGDRPTYLTHELEGYNAAKAAYEKQEAAYQVTEIWEQVDSKELAELRAKAKNWDDLQTSLGVMGLKIERYL